ncbi:MAG: hypothetical protein JWO91_620 [Acidobacteriaceae bacterium]|nr:hypothetical protein [Acidobacteriaceae bacterium]
MSLLCKDLVDVAALGEVDASKFVSRGRFHQIAASLGHPNSGYIQQKFPELCTAIAKRIVQAKPEYAPDPKKRPPRRPTAYPHGLVPPSRLLALSHSAQA